MDVLTNATTSISTMATISPIAGWLITFGIFVGVLFTIFLLSKNFRQFIYGAVISTFAILNFKFSRWVGKTAVENNFEPLKWTGYIVGFIIASIIIGKLLLKLDFVKKLDKQLTK